MFLPPLTSTKTRGQVGERQKEEGAKAGCLQHARGGRVLKPAGFSHMQISGWPPWRERKDQFLLWGQARNCIKNTAGVTVSPRTRVTTNWQFKSKLGGDGQPMDIGEGAHHGLCSQTKMAAGLEPAFGT